MGCQEAVRSKRAISSGLTDITNCILRQRPADLSTYHCAACLLDASFLAPARIHVLPAPASPSVLVEVCVAPVNQRRITAVGALKVGTFSRRSSLLHQPCCEHTDLIPTAALCRPCLRALAAVLAGKSALAKTLGGVVVSADDFCRPKCRYLHQARCIFAILVFFRSWGPGVSPGGGLGGSAPEAKLLAAGEARAILAFSCAKMTSNMHSFENEGLTSEPLGSEHDEQQVSVPTYQCS